MPQMDVTTARYGRGWLTCWTRDWGLSFMNLKTAVRNKPFDIFLGGAGI